MLKGVIFDFDGTLFDSMFVWDMAGEAYLRSLGKQPEAELPGILKPMSLRQSAEYLQARYQLALSAEEICTGINRTVEDYYFHTVQPKPGVIELLEELYRRKVNMCIATATDRYQVEAALKRCHMQQFFSAIFTCSEVGSGKDQPQIYHAALAHLRADKGSVLIVEDACHALQTAKQAGFTVVGVYDAHEVSQDRVRSLSDIYLPDFSDLTELWKFASS